MSQSADKTDAPLTRLLERLTERQPSDVVCDLPRMLLEERADDAESSAGGYTLALGVLPFAGSVPSARITPAVRSLAHSRRAELVALAWTLQALRPGGRAFLVVPPSLLAADSRGHQELRRHLVEGRALDAVIKLGPGWCPPRRAAVLLALRQAVPVETVWFCEMASPPSSASTAGKPPSAAGPAMDPDELSVRWRARAGSERERPRSASSFCVPSSEIAAAGHRLDIEHYRTPAPLVVPAAPRPTELLQELAGLEAEIFEDLRRLVGMLR